jgi:pimeloyl-ACP methyl ester carboxylesterase
MSTLGREDPRIVNLAGALANAGYRVLIPDFPSIRALEIRRQQPGEVLAQLETLAEDPQLVPGVFSLMAVSFSAVFALRAACSKRLAPRICGLCLIGGYYDPGVVSSFLLRANRSDPYGQLLVLRSFYREVEPQNATFHQVLNRCISENIEQTNAWSADQALDRSDPVEGWVYQMLMDPVERERLDAKVTRAFVNEWHGYQSKLDFVYPDTPVFLIHGRDDRLIPSGESKRLARRLLDEKIPAYLCITRFLSHGDSAIRLGQLPELARLLRGFAWFFQLGDQAKRKGLQRR